MSGGRRAAIRAYVPPHGWKRYIERTCNVFISYMRAALSFGFGHGVRILCVKLISRKSPRAIRTAKPLHTAQRLKEAFRKAATCLLGVPEIPPKLHQALVRKLLYG